MKLTVERKPIADALAIASGPIMPRHTIPVLACVLLTAKDNALTITGTSMDTEVHGRCEAAVSSPGTCCVSAAGLGAAVNSTPKGALVTIDLSDLDRLGEGSLTVSAGRFAAKFQTRAVDEFPTMKKPDADCEVVGWEEALAFCLPYSSQEEARYYLKGVYLSEGFATATDGYRLGNIPCETNGASAIIPRHDIPMMLKAGGRLWVGQNSWRLEAEGVAMAGKLVAGTFPDWTRVMPKEKGALATVDADAMAIAAKSAVLNDGKSVVITGNGDTLTLTGGDFQTAGFTSGVADIPCEGGAEWSTRLNAKCLLELLSTMAGRVLTFTGGDGVWLVTSEGFTGRAVIMGMRF